MFRQPFSFDGRIRRSEYGLTLLICWGYAAAIRHIIISGHFPITITRDNVQFYYWLCLIPAIVFNLAQGAKRCHDNGKNGFWQLIPVFFIYLLMANPENLTNQYGPNPRVMGSQLN